MTLPNQFCINTLKTGTSVSQPKKFINSYYNLEKASQVVSQGRHRGWIGGLWEEMGRLQFEFLRQQGLTPDMYVLDVGCGCLRGGVHLVEYLQPGHYYGTDISQDLLDAGYDIELKKLGLQNKLPRKNLLCNENFDATSFGISFDIAIAQSLFTHLPLNHIKLCLIQLTKCIRIHGVFYATVFLSPESHDWCESLKHPKGGIITHPTDDPYHYRKNDLAACVTDLPWHFESIGEWNHPRDQMMVKFTRTRTRKSWIKNIW